MGLRFRKRIKLAPGLNLNIGLGGVSLSAGVRGANVTVGKRGVRGNVGIPGSGLSYSEQLMSFSGKKSRGTPAGQSPSSIYDQVRTFRLTLDDAMNIMVELDLGNGFAGDYADKATWNKIKLDHAEQIRRWLEQAATDLNAQLDCFTSIHEEAPAPSSLFNQIARFTQAPPELRLPEPLGVLERMNPFANRRFNEQTNEARIQYAQDIDEYEQRRDQHDQYMKILLAKQRQTQVGNIEAMEDMLSDGIAKIDWPKETLIDFEFSNSETLAIQVDLPEIEDLPTSRYTVKDNLAGLSGSKILQAERLGMYKLHVFGIVTRIVSQAFAVLPTLEHLTLSAYTQRRNSSGELNDEDVFSIQTTRQEWPDLYNNVVIDPLHLMNAQSVRVKITSSGKFSRITPHMAELVS